MFKIACKFIIPRGYIGLSIGPFIFVRERSMLKNYKLINHETIHFYQQLELLFVFHWILYGLFFLRGILRGLSAADAYKNNPFELEANRNEDDFTYIFKRKPYAWRKLI